jgi:hypothetical protein
LFRHAPVGRVALNQQSTQNSGEKSMRPGQQNKRGRGRGNNNNNNNGGGGNNFNRKGSNPLTRTYDSSGPDVKIRGTAQHIAEKYSTLARDAQSAGDRVMAENYLQHAEHYNRIIAAAQAQMQERTQRDERQDYNDRDNERDNDRDGDDMDGGDNEEFGASQPAPQQHQQPQPQPQQPAAPRQQPAPRQQAPRQPAPKVAPVAEEAPAIDGSGPQPVIEGTPAEVAIEEEGATARQPRRRNASNRPRRPRRTAEGGEGEATGGDAPALADAGSE